MFAFVTVLLILLINIAIVLFFTYSFVFLIVLLTSVVFLCCYFPFIYVGTFPIVFSLLFCVSSSFLILDMLPFHFFTGYGTTHKVNNFLIQNGRHFGSSTDVRSPKNKKSRRSLIVEYKTCYNVTHFSSKRIGLAPKEVDFDQFQNPVVLAERNMNDFLWVFLRWHSVPKQIIPSWTGFNSIILNGMVLLKPSVNHLHCIHTPATEITTIYQVY